MTTPSGGVRPEVMEALEEIRATFPRSSVDSQVVEDGNVWVSVSDIFIGEQWVPSHTTISFTISFQYPYADCYPHFIDASVNRADGGQLPAGMQSAQQTPRGEAAVMISRRNNHAAEVPDAAAVKLVKVVNWVRAQ